MKRELIIFLFCSALFIPDFLTAQTVDCYNSTRAQGITLMQQGHYAQAIQVFESAQSCPDKPENNDLQAKISECRDKILVQDEASRLQESDSQRKKEVAAKAYMDITGILFKNEDYNGKEITPYGKPLYVGGIKYISPKITYNGLSSEEKQVDLYIKIFGNDQKLLTGSNSPDGYTTKRTCTIRSGKQELQLSGWGNNTGGTYYKVGKHRYEVWYEGRKIYSAEFTIEANPTAMRLLANGEEGLGLSFSERGGEESVLVSTDASSWFLSKVPSWCSVSQQTSSGFVLKCQENTMTRYRTGIMEVLAGEKKVMVEIMQLAAAKSHFAEGIWLAPMRKTVEHPAKTYSNGVYKGTLSFSDLRDGLGIYYFYDAGCYWGHFYDNIRDGEGVFLASSNGEILNCPGCIVYVGEFSNGKKSGHGRCYDKYGELLYDGAFTDDRPAETYPSATRDPSRKFECIVTARGTCNLCETVDGKKDGLVMQIAKNGDALIVEFKNDVRDGEGLYLYYNNPVTRYGLWKGDTYEPKIRNSGS